MEPNNNNHGDAEPKPPMQAVDLFAGAGGLSLGLTESGLEVKMGADHWPLAAKTYKYNFPEHSFIEGDLSQIDGATLISEAKIRTGPWALVGGPPCQGFSSAGLRREGDHRNTLVGVYAQFIASLRPDVAIFENVEGFLTAEGGRFVFDLLDPLIEAGYRIILRKVNVANFGVPQLRKRVIAIAALGRNPADLTPTHRAFGAPGVWRVGTRDLPVTRTFWEAVENLPPAAEGKRETKPSLHTYSKPRGTDLERIAGLKPGQTMRDLPEDLWHESYRRRANRRVADGTPTERRGGAPAGLRRLIGEEPSKAITGAASREFIHPIEDRPLTLRECARIQTFPDWYDFLGPQADCVKMIGNAIPPSFAKALGLSILQTMENPLDSNMTGRLLRFEVTAADGMSPALKGVVSAVESRYGKTSPPVEVPKTASAPSQAIQEGLWL